MKKLIMATHRLRTKPASNLSPEQKVAFGLLLFLGLGGVFFGFQSFGANLMRPIHQQIADLYSGDTFLSSSDREAQELEASKSKDTDGDGLVDYDELYVYKTSPYIADSDSDGYTDQEEIFSGNNPNCPTGKTCGVSASGGETAGAGVGTDGLLEAIGVEEPELYAEVDLNSPEALEVFFEQATLEQIRAALLDAGVSQEELDAIDDDTLKLFFDDLIEAAITPDVIDAAASTDPQATQP